MRLERHPNVTTTRHFLSITYFSLRYSLGFLWFVVFDVFAVHCCLCFVSLTVFHWCLVICFVSVALLPLFALLCFLCCVDFNLFPLLCFLDFVSSAVCSFALLTLLWLPSVVSCALLPLGCFLCCFPLLVSFVCFL